MNRDTIRRSGIASLLVLVIAAATCAVEPSPSALERDPEGWVDTLAGAGSNLKGWTRGSIPPGKRVSPESQWRVDGETGYLVCEGNGGHEWVRWDRMLSDFVFHVEWRFTSRPGKSGYNSGIYARNSADATVWHQAQTGSGSGGYIFGDTLVGGTSLAINLAKQSREQRVKPAGEWNTYEITCKGRDMILWVNGAVTNAWHDCEVPRGFVGLEAEGWRIEFRNVKVKPLTKP
jgi:hypothetical protein